MAQSQAQTLTVSLPSPQTLDISQTFHTSQAQQLTITLATGYILLDINPAQKLPTG